MLKTHPAKATVVDESNNPGIWGRELQPPEVNGGSESEPPTLQRFYSFLSKNTHFLAYFDLNFCLKLRLLMADLSVLMRLEARVPTCPPPLLRH